MRLPFLFPGGGIFVLGMKYKVEDFKAAFTRPVAIATLFPIIRTIPLQ